MKKKYLIESLFDDDILDSFDNPFDDVIEQTTTEPFLKLCKDTLCQNGDYHSIIPEDLEDGFTQVKTDPDNPDILYVGLTATYKTMNLGPRKRKQYNLGYFYRYSIIFNDDGTITLNVKKFSDKNYCILNSYIVNFIEGNTYYKIKTINFLSGSQSKLCPPFDKILIFPDRGKKISTSFVNNFPDDIQPHANEAEQDTLFNPTTLFKSSFQSEDTFFKLVKKIINLGYVVADNKNIRYNKSNIDKLSQEYFSGERDNKLKEVEQQRTQFINNKLGVDKKGIPYIDKINKLINYFDTVLNKKMYFKSINTLRNNYKIALFPTVQMLRKENNVITLLDKDDPNYSGYYEYSDNDPELAGIDYNILKIILFKMFYIMNDEGLQSYKEMYNLKHCMNGVEYEYNYGYYETKSLNINDLPIIIKSPGDFYILYYVIGKAIIQCKSLKDRHKDNFSYAENYIINLDKSKNIDMNTFNFDYLTDQLKFIIDKACKKYKLK